MPNYDPVQSPFIHNHRTGYGKMIYPDGAEFAGVYDNGQLVEMERPETTTVVTTTTEEATTTTQEPETTTRRQKKRRRGGKKGGRGGAQTTQLKRI